MHISLVPTRIALALGFAAAGCADTGNHALTYEQFVARAYHEPDTGIVIANGDEPAADEAQLEQLYGAYLDTVARMDESGHGIRAQSSIVNLDSNGSDDVWSAQQALNLTYCVSSSSFGSNYNAVVTALSEATGAWEQAANGRLDFIHNSASDGNCTASTSGVVFDVRQTSTTSYLARAFFPSSSRASRNILISTSAFSGTEPWTLAGILRHELGHTIGLRHEHTRPESGDCYEDDAWRALTAYDAESVMHYPQCNGTQDGDLVLTASDRDGAAALYP